MKYFKNIETLEQLKKAYKENAFKLHPDNGGNSSEFVEMQEEYKELFEKVKNVQVKADGSIYEKETTETPEEFINIINEVLKMGDDDVVVELIGVWLWVSGNTKDHKEKLKELGFKWAPKKFMWSWHYDDGRKHYTTREKSIEELRGCYGSKIYKNKINNKLEEKKQ